MFEGGVDMPMWRMDSTRVRPYRTRPVSTLVVAGALHFQSWDTEVNR